MITFNVPSLVGRELEYIRQAVELGQLSGEGLFARKCSQAIANLLGDDSHVILTPSCTAALEMSALLFDIGPGDEVIMPSFTFVSTANAFALRGARPVFADIDPETMNIRPSEIARLITKRTKAIVIVHYAGWPCDMDAIMSIANEAGIPVIEDAAHALGSNYRGKPLGSFGQIATFSFHETKNIHCGEGGALVINNPELIDRAYILRDKGTNRRNFSRGDVPFYAWVDLGSSYVISDVLAAYLFAQLEHLQAINARRWEITRRYADGLQGLLKAGHIWFPSYCLDDASSASANGHLFFILPFDNKERTEMQKYLMQSKVTAVFHYQPLHQSPYIVSRWGQQESLPVTEEVAARLLRMPMYYTLSDSYVDYIIGCLQTFYQQKERERRRAADSRREVLEPVRSRRPDPVPRQLADSKLHG